MNIIIEESKILQLIKEVVADGIREARLSFIELPDELSAKDMARYMGVSPTTVTNWYRRGMLPATQKTKRGNIIITKEDAIAFKKKYNKKSYEN